MKVKRSLRVAELIKREMGAIIFQRIKDPSVKMISITSVKVTDDLKLAKIYYRVFGDDKAKADAAVGLERASKFLRAELGHRAEFRYVPELTFYYDDSIDYAAHIDNLIDKIKSD